MAYEIYDPYESAPNDSYEDDVLAQQGWEEFLGIGDDLSALRIRSFRRATENGDEYIADVSDVGQGSPFVKVNNIGELMDLFARWAPAVQAAAVVQVLDAVQSYSLSKEGVMEVIAAKAAYGADVGRDALVAHERQQASYRREAAARHKAAREAARQQSQ